MYSPPFLITWDGITLHVNDAAGLFVIFITSDLKRDIPLNWKTRSRLSLAFLRLADSCGQLEVTFKQFLLT